MVIEDGSIMLYDRGESLELIELSRLGFTAQGRIRFQVANALAAAAAAWGAGLNPALIARALTTFRTDAALVPGRFNVMNVGGVEVVLDYGHNEAAMAALGEAVQSLGKRRTVMAVCLPGDRKDKDLVSTFSATLPWVDEYVLHDSLDRRGRQPNELPNLLRTRIPGNVPHQIAPDQRAAVETAWRTLKAGDRLVVIADEVDEALSILRNQASKTADDDAFCESPVSPTELYQENHRDHGGMGGGGGGGDVHARRTW